MTITTLPERTAELDPRLRGPVQRWRPERAGVVNVWQYAEETLEFEDGKLLLFGANGSGKTMLLELLLPYLLDANKLGDRLSTSGKNDRGGLWDRVSGYESGTARTGYLWITFARTFDDGRTERFTCGTWLRTKAAGGGIHAWFTTILAPGRDLDLLDEHRRPLDVAGLTAALGEHGTVWGKDTASYRSAVRTTLYGGFNPLRLEALIASLLTARRQSVTDGLSPDRLDALLRDGLPPNDEAEIGKLARGYEELDRRRDQIVTMETDVELARDLAGAARRYARAVIAAHADDRVASETRKDDVTRKERVAQQRLADARDGQRTIDEQLTMTADQLNMLDAKITALRETEAFRDATELNVLRELVEQSERTAATSNTRAKSDRQTATQRRIKADQLAHAARTAADQLRSALDELSQAASAAGLGDLDTDDTDPDVVATTCEAQLAALAEAVKQVRVALRTFENERATRDLRQGGLEEADAQLRDAKSGLVDAHKREATARHDWRTQAEEWASSLVELDRELVTSRLVEVETPAELHVTVRDTYDTAAATLTETKQTTEAWRRQLADQREPLAVERARLAQGGLDRPAAPDGRRDRTELRGAPLWELVAFDERVTSELAATLEAALDSAGLLDAWVNSDGTVEFDGADVVLGATLTDPETTNLTSVLTVEDQPEVDASHLEAILRRVAYTPVSALRDGPAGLTIGADGTWRAGPAHGRASVQGPARYIGSTTREHRRLERVNELEEQLATLDGQTEQCVRELATLEERRQAARTERDAATVPAEETLRTAERAVERADERVSASAGQLQRADEQLQTAEAALQSAQRELARTAGRYGLPTEPSALDAREAAYSVAANQTHTVHERNARAVRAAQQADESEGEAVTAEQAAVVTAGQAADDTAEAEATRARYTELKRSAGANVDQVLADLTAAQRNRKQRIEDQKRLTGELATTQREVGAAETTLATAEEVRRDAEAERDIQHEALRRITAAGLAVDAGLELSGELTTVTATLAAAQTIRSSLGTLTRTRQAVARALGQLNEQEHLASRGLAGRADVSVVPDDSGAFSVLTTRVDGVALRAPQLRETFETKLDQAQHELSASEEQVFEQTLTGAVRSHLAERIRQATETVATINTLLEQVQTAAGGVRVKLDWAVDGSEVDDVTVLTSIKRLLLGSHHTPEEQQELHRFLRRQIDRVRAAEDDTGSWQDRLDRVLDYRRWHRFSVLIHHDRFGDTPVAFGSRKVTLSAGEKTVALTVPLIAAIAAHYLPRSGDELPDCPRLLLMDELFPKVDRANKRLLLGLINDLGLDAVFTSDKDWCDYDTLDAIAIHVVQKDGDRSLTTRMIWNGVRREIAPVSDNGARDSDDLFDHRDADVT